MTVYLFDRRFVVEFDSIKINRSHSVKYQIGIAADVE
jgi:hypothetical protein